MDFLNKIIEHKKAEIAATKRKKPIRELEKAFIKKSAPRRSFKEALLTFRPAIIAEIKRKSPSKGALRDIEHPERIARQYEQAGAAAISVLTDSKFFGGSLKDIETIRSNVEIPVLRKDFIIDVYQVYETKYCGADALLLISSCLECEQVRELMRVSRELGLDVLVETETAEDIEKIKDLGVEIIGINNRNLHTFEESIEQSRKLFPFLPASAVKITESGIKYPRQVVDLYNTGFRGFLIGETFMRSHEPGTLLRNFIKEFKKSVPDENVD